LASKVAVQIIKSKNGFKLPASASANWHKNRFALPYMRETLIQNRILIDMFETVTYWSNLIPLYHHIKESLKNNSDYFDKGGILFCHVSHIYETGASLYFTLMAPQEKGNEIPQWENIKSIISNTIIKKGGAISHHHGVGKDHRKWYLEQLNPQTKQLLNAIKNQLDPNNIMNTGKLFDSNPSEILHSSVNLSPHKV
jgi:alkyldihydroxyacetonephosphate synthase